MQPIQKIRQSKMACAVLSSSAINSNNRAAKNPSPTPAGGHAPVHTAMLSWQVKLPVYGFS